MTSPEPALAPAPDQVTRWQRRMQAALEVLSEQSAPMGPTEMEAAAAERVPLSAYEASKNNSGVVRASTNLRWLLTTVCQHAGWLATSKSGFRLTSQGRAGLAEHHNYVELFERGLSLYQQWDAERNEVLPDRPGELDRDVLHPGSKAAHALAATGTLVEAWRQGASALQPDARAWTASSVDVLAAQLSNGDADLSLVQLEDPAARLLAAELLALLHAPLADVKPAVKRQRIRQPLMHMGEPPPGLPVALSAHLESGFVRGATLASDPISLLRSGVEQLRQWFAATDAQRSAGWSDPWAFRDLLAPARGVDERVAALLCLAAHPNSYTTLLHSGHRQSVVAAFADQLSDPLIGDTEQDIKRVLRALQQEAGGAVDLEALPLVARWRETAKSPSAWLVRGEVDQQNRVPGWLTNGRIAVSAGKFTSLAPVSDAVVLAATVDSLYGDLPLAKREAKQRDVTAFVHTMRPGDLVCTVEGPSLRLGRLGEDPSSLASIDGSTVLVRPVTWARDASPAITGLPDSIGKRLRFKGEDVVNLTEVYAELDGLVEADAEDEVVPEDLVDLPTPADTPAAPTPARAELSADLGGLAAALHHADDSWLVELLTSLNERRQVVLEGAPGTGKTYTALQLLTACGLTAAQQALVQFHPTYSYEDFVEGFRPDAAGGGHPTVGHRRTAQAAGGRGAERARQAARAGHRRDQPREPGEGLRRAVLPARVPRPGDRAALQRRQRAL